MFKIGDLGHITPLDTVRDIEEGDCRYLAPESLLHDFRMSNLKNRADIFSLGVTMFEAASLQKIPKNSNEGAELFYRIQEGDLPYLERYSREFNELLRVRKRNLD